MTWRVGPIQSVTDSAGNFSGTGFVLHDGNDRTCVTFGFRNDADAKRAAENIRAVLAAAAEITRVPG